MCLERCGFTSDEIAQQLDTIKQYSDVLSAVSFELFNLGDNSTLLINNFTQVAQPIKAMNLEGYAMISSWPYPKEFIDWMRTLFSNPDSFIADAIKMAQTIGFTGYCIDFEPTVNGTAEDATNYAAFLDLFAKQLHE